MIAQIATKLVSKWEKYYYAICIVLLFLSCLCMLKDFFSPGLGLTLLVGLAGGKEGEGNHLQCASGQEQGASTS